MRDTFPILKTERLVLRKIEESDAHSIMEYLSDEEVVQYYGLEPFETIQDALSEIAWYQKIWNEKTGVRWGITRRGENQVIGSCGFLNIAAQHFRAEIGYELHRHYWGQGIATEAIEAILRFGFEQLKFQRIQALIEPPNIPSQKLLEKQGFTQEGLLRNYEYTSGNFDDLYMYSLLKKEFIYMKK
ncbi:GNAT family N-acetyltransferase [Ornithinibacillus sp. L9]|uniref:GNAT family N-acetyltransferase n=1 Tax=Ornithinibacillus caprae TaxID=2678566 RepID=A0A6N8FM98_9BACI|nr:GNAT family N-acetyltransferase [Ornithinibacillus caprae]